MYRLRTADKGRPLVISDRILDEYKDCEVDTLHKKNLLSLGEDRYLTTLMTKHFPAMSYKFVPDAYASTAAPETWSVLVSQRRRWINSTIHNLAELVFLQDLCGFCCFSMRFVVFIDLFGTIILPATCAYLGYLIYRVATHSGQFPLISIIMIASVYGLQAIIFIIKRQWQHIGWMIIYIIAFPIYSFVLPIYSFWNQDNFTWGSTRIVIGDKGDKKIIAVEDDGFDPRSIPLQRWDDYAATNNLPGRRGGTGSLEKVYQSGYDNRYEMDDLHSVYSSVRPASTMLTGFPTHTQPYMPPPPQSTGPFGPVSNRHSAYSTFVPYTDAPPQVYDHHRFSTPGFNDADNPFASHPALVATPSTDNLLAMQSPPLPHPHRQSRTSLGGFPSRPVSTLDFQRSTTGPDDGAIVDAIRTCLNEVDLDTVTKKQGMSSFLWILFVFVCFEALRVGEGRWMMDDSCVGHKRNCADVCVADGSAGVGRAETADGAGR
jgi:chitin synthase